MISITNPSTPSKDTKAPDIKKLKKVEQDVEKIKNNIQRNVQDIDKSMTDFGEKSAKLLCLLRLDMAADKLDKVSSKLASQIDAIANTLERETISTWGNVTGSTGECLNPHPNYVQNPENCPVCGNKYAMTCRCRIGNKVCPDKHEWFTCDEHQKVYVGDPHNKGVMRQGSKCICPGKG